MSASTATQELMTPKKAATWVVAILISLFAIASFGNAGIVFALLIGLMLTGMPISISLGLTVLSFLFFMSPRTGETVAMKLLPALRSLRSWPYRSLSWPVTF